MPRQEACGPRPSRRRPCSPSSFPHVSSPGQSWRDERFLLPRDFHGERVRLVAVDDAVQPFGWLGVSTPRAISPSAWMLRWSEETSPVSLGVALTLVCLALLLPRWLRGIGEERSRALARRAAHHGPAAALTLVTVAFATHLTVLYRYAVDVPYLSEWWHLSSGLAREFSFEWLWSRHAEQRMVFTKFHTWLLAASGGWNLRAQILQNFALYGVLLAAGFAFLRRNAPHIDRSLLLLCFVFPLSAIANENHQWGAASHFHFVLLFLVLSAHFAFSPGAGTASALAAGALGVATTLSSATGAASMAGLLGVLAAYTASNRWREIDSTGATAGARLARLALIGVPVGIAIASQIGGHGAGSSALQSNAERIAHFLNLVSGGFGVSSSSVLLGSFWFAVVIVPLAAGLVWARGRLADGDWAILALSIALLCGLAATSLVNAGQGAAEAKHSRYAELAMLLLPLCAAAWSSLFRVHAVAGRRVLASLLALVAFASLDDWNTEPYRLQRVAREGGVACAKHYYERAGRAHCPTIAGQPIAHELDRARELDLHFYQRIVGGRVP